MLSCAERFDSCVIMTDRADFSLATKRALAQRVGYRCSFPGCGAMTIGPSDESPSATANVGMACHIAAAARGCGARRVVASMTPSQLKAIDNAIWMCYTHGKLIDADEGRFTIPMLQQWRRIAERRAQLAVDFGQLPASPNLALLEIGLAETRVKLGCVGPENTRIGDALHDSCVPLVWGRDVAQAVRDVTIEIVRNAFTHGRATEVTMHIDKLSIRLDDDGSPFDPLALSTHQRASGGAKAIRNLLDSFGERLVVTSERVRARNRTLFALITSPAQVSRITPCTVDLRPAMALHSAKIAMDMVESCKRVYVVLPKYLSPSDINDVAVCLQPLRERRRALVFIAQEISDLVRRELLELSCGGNVMVL